MENVEAFSNIVGTISKILSHPLLIAVVSIFLGSGLIERINRRKEKREQKRLEAIKLSEEISDVLNNDLTWLFWQVRSESNKISEDFAAASRNAFKHRLKIKVKVKTYLGEEDVLKEYDSIIKEIALLRRTIADFENDKFDETETLNHISGLQLKWNISKNYPIEDLKFPFNHYYSWSQTIWYKVESFISKLLVKSINID